MARHSAAKPPAAWTRSLERARRLGRVLLVDPGASSLRVAIVKLYQEGQLPPDGNPSRFRVEGFAEAPSRAVASAGIVNVAEFERILRRLVDQVERQANVGRVDEVTMAVKSPNLPSFHARGDAEVVGGRIRDQDVFRAMSRCARPVSPDPLAILHAAPIQFTIDDRDGILEPRGLVGRNMIVDMLWSTAPAAMLDEFARSAAACGLKPAGFVAAPYAAGHALPGPGDGEGGFAVLDIGASATGIGVFLKGKCLRCSAVGGGLQGIAGRIAAELGLDPAEAELAAGGGGARSGLPEAERIRQDGLARMFRKIQEVLRQSDFYRMPGRKVFLCGGGAFDPQVHSLATGVLGCPAAELQAAVRREDSLRSADSLSGCPAADERQGEDLWWPSERALRPDTVVLRGMARLAMLPNLDLRELEALQTLAVVGMARRTLAWIRRTW